MSNENKSTYNQVSFSTAGCNYYGIERDVLRYQVHTCT